MCDCFTDSNIYPQADAEHAITAGTESDTHISTANLGFADSHGGHVDHRGELTDDLSRSLVEEHVSLDNFFARPLKVQEYTWDIENAFFESFDPWSLYFENKRVINRICNFRLLKATLHMKIVVNGTPLHFGRLMASYTPLIAYDTLTPVLSDLKNAFTSSQKPHVYLNPTISQGGSIRLPFFTPLNFLDIPKAQWNTMGLVTIHELAELRHANGGLDPVTINIFVWAENVELAGLTQQNPLGIVPQSQSEYTGILSKPASSIARYAGILKEIPYISRFAMASEMGASSIAKIANFFGYCRPADVHPNMLLPVSTSNVVNADGRQQLAKMCVDSKQELSVDPAIAGLEPHDEMTIQSIACRETLVSKFAWKREDPPEKLLYNIIVDPCVIQPCSNWDNFVHNTSLSHITFPFNYWRGSLKYRFQIACSAFHKGRLKIVWDSFRCPNLASAPIPAEYNTAYVQIVDIAQENDFSIVVGWGQSTPWRHHLEREQTNNYAYSPAILGEDAVPVPYDSGNTFNIGNGVLSVYVVNPIVSPNSDANNDLDILVSISACDDYEVAVPNYQHREFGYLPSPLAAFGDGAYSPLILTTSGIDPPPEDILLDNSVNNELELTTIKEENDEFVPQAAMEQIMKLDNPVQNVTNTYHLGPACKSQDVISKVYMGETITSIRSLLKRFSFHEVIRPIRKFTTTDIRHTHNAFLRRNFPYYGGFTSVTPGNNNVVVGLTYGNLFPAVTTLMNYLAPAYGGWRGGIRYMVDVGGTLTGSNAYWNCTKINFNETLVLPERNDDTHEAVVDDTANLLQYLRRINASNVHPWSSHVNPVQTVEIPYQTLYKFCPTRTVNIYSINKDPFQSSWEFETLGLYGTVPRLVTKYVAAGDDFTFLFYLGAPRMYYRPFVTNR